MPKPRVGILCVIPLLMSAGAATLSAGQGRLAAAAADVSPTDKNSSPKVDFYGDPLPPDALVRLGTYRFRHAHGTSVVFAQDGKTLITCGSNPSIRYWDLASGRLLRQQQVPLSSTSIWPVLSHKGDLLAFQELYDAGGAIQFWDLAKDKLRFKVPAGHLQHGPLFSPDGKYLVSVTHRDYRIQVWDVGSGEGRVIGSHPQLFIEPSFSANGTLITADGSDNAEVRFWDLAVGREKSRIKIPRVLDALISPDGKTIALRCWHNPGQDKGLIFLDADSGKPKKRWLPPDDKKVFGFAFAPDGKTIMVCLEDRVLVWDPVQGRSVRTLPAKIRSDFVFSPDGRTVCASDYSKHARPNGPMLYVWKLASGQLHPCSSAAMGHQGEVNGLAIAPDGRTIASSARDVGVRLWNAGTGRLLRTIPVEAGKDGLAFSPDGKTLFVCVSSAIRGYETTTAREVSRHSAAQPSKHDLFLSAMCLTNDGQQPFLLSTSAPDWSQWRLHRWDVSTAKTFSTDLALKSYTASASKFSPDGRLLVVQDPKGGIRDTATGKVLFQFDDVADRMWHIAPVFSADSSLLAMAVGKRTPASWHVAVQVWETATLLPITRLETGEIWDMTFSADGRGLITAGSDALKLWDLADGKLITDRRGPEFSCLALAADGHTVITGHRDTTCLVWSLATGPRSPCPLSASQLEKCWSDLADPDARRAFTAFAILADSPKQAVTLLEKRLVAAGPLAAGELERLIADLDSPEFARRETAQRRLAVFGELGVPALKRALRACELFVV